MSAASEQGIRLELPKVKPPRHKALGLLLGSILLLIVISGALWLWLTLGFVDSRKAMVDGQAYTLTPRMTDTVTEVLVRPGQSVDAGQPLLRLQGLAYQTELAEAQQRVLAARPPSLEETAERVAKAQAAEASMVQRIALARGEETNRRKMIEDVVGEHVKAQLALRSLDAQGVPRNQSGYKHAVQSESAARARMESARAAAEEASRVRVAVESELLKVRREMEAYRAQGFAQGAQGQQVAGQARAPGLGGTGGAGAPLPTEDLTLLKAPMAGRVVMVQAVAGQRVERGQAVVQLVPSALADLWIMASFAEEDAVRVRPGQPCTVRLHAYAEQELQGQVESVLPVSAEIMALMQSGDTFQSTGQSTGQSTVGTPPEGAIPVRVRLNPAENQALPELFLGMAAKVSVQTRHLPAFMLRWL